MKFHQLQVFVAIAMEKSLRAAARRLGLTQPAVTRSIQELEADMGVTLVERSVRGIELTDYGRAFLMRAQSLLQDAQRARDELDQMRGEMRGRMAFCGTSSISLTILPRTVKQFRMRAPRTELVLLEAKLLKAIAGLSDGSIDLAASHVFPGQIPDGLESLALMKAEFVILTRPGHPLAQARRLEQFADVEWLPPVADNVQSTILRMAFERIGLPPPPRFIQSGSLAITLGMVMDTDAVGVFSRPLAVRLARLGLHAVELDDPLPALQFCALRRHNVPPTPVAQHFLECLMQSARLLERRLADGGDPYPLD